MKKINDLIAELAQDAPALKPAPHPFMLSVVWITAAVIYLAVLMMFSGVRPDLLLKLNEPWFAAEMATLIGICIATSLSAALLSFPDLYQMRRVVFAPAFTFLVFVLTLFFAWNADMPPAPLPVHSFKCTVTITLLAILPAVGIFFVMQKFASTHRYWAGSIAMLFAFSVGAIWLRLYEVNDSITHVIAWHYLPMVVFGLLGIWLGKVVLKW